MDKKFKPGDVVRLKSGGEKMTVIDYEKIYDIGNNNRVGFSIKGVSDTDKVKCAWFEGKKRRMNAFQEDLLEPA